MPPRIDGAYYIRFVSTQNSGTFIAVGSNEPNFNTCDAPISIDLPYVYDGSGDWCWTTTGTISNVNSWNLNSLVINGEDYTNGYFSNIPADENGEYLIEYSSSVGWGHFEATGSNGSNGNSCDAPETINLPFVQEGVGEFCFTTTEAIGNINSWSLNSLLINGDDYTNGYFSDIPADANGEYLIEYSSSVAWGHFDANPPAGTMASGNNGSSFSQNQSATLYESEVDGTDLRNGVEASVKVYPIPARDELFLQMNDFLGKDVNITLINRLGQTMKMLELDNLEDSTLNIPLEELGNGLYYIRLIIDQKDLINKSFIIQK